MPQDLTESRRCTAKAKRSGTRCARWAILGGKVCPTHGGGAPQVQRSARERLNALVDPALAQLTRLVESPKVLDAVKLAAIRDILDRAGYGKHTRVEVTSTSFTFSIQSASAEDLASAQVVEIADEDDADLPQLKTLPGRSRQ